MEATEPTMSRLLRVKLNMPELIRNMSKEEGRPVDEGEVNEWLTAAGFTPADENTWIIPELEMGHLDPSEVEWVEPINDSH